MDLQPETYLTDFDQFKWSIPPEDFHCILHEKGIEAINDDGYDIKIRGEENIPGFSNIEFNLLTYIHARINFCANYYAALAFGRDPDEEIEESGNDVKIEFDFMSDESSRFDEDKINDYEEDRLEKRAKEGVRSFINFYYPESAEDVAEVQKLPHEGSNHTVHAYTNTYVKFKGDAFEEGQSLEDFVDLIKSDIVINVSQILKVLRDLSSTTDLSEILEGPEFSEILYDTLTVGLEEIIHAIDGMMLITYAIVQTYENREPSNVSNCLSLLSDRPLIAS